MSLYIIMGIFLAILFDFSCNCELETNFVEKSHNLEI